MTAKGTFLPHAVPANCELNGSSGQYVAIVDDEESVCRAFARLLRTYSFRPQTYQSGPEFLESLKSRVPACLIVDVHLGDINGFEVLRRLTDIGVNIPAIVLTARDEPGVQRDFAFCGAAVLLNKPVAGNALLNAIETAMSTSGGCDAAGRESANQGRAIQLRTTTRTSR
jgi:FixJ family two-component response regulator